MLFNVNGNNVAKQFPNLMDIDVNLLNNVVGATAIRFRGDPYEGADHGLYSVRLYASDNTYFGRIYDITKNEALEIARIRPGSDAPENNGGDNGADAPSIFIGNQSLGQSAVSFFVNTGTVNGVPNTLPAAWMTLRAEITWSGAISREFQVAPIVSGGNPLPIMYRAILNDKGHVVLNVPVTITL